MINDEVRAKTNKVNMIRMAEHRRIHSEGKSAASDGMSTIECPYDGIKRRTWMNGYDEIKLLGGGR